VEGPHQVVGADALALELRALHERQAAQKVVVVLHGEEEPQAAVVERI